MAPEDVPPIRHVVIVEQRTIVHRVRDMVEAEIGAVSLDLEVQVNNRGAWVPAEQGSVRIVSRGYYGP